MMVLTGLAVLPGVVIIAKVYSMDKVEKEPIRLLLLLLILGALSVIPVIVVETLLDSVIGIIPRGTFYNIIENFIGVALVEEFFKYLVLKKCTWNNKAFDYRFDAVVYAVTASLGFAILENIMYVLGGGVHVAIVRALLSVPGHAMFGLFMGLAYGEAKACAKRGFEANSKKLLKNAVIIPMILHGFYDFTLSEGTALSLISFYIFMICMYVVTWKKLKQSSKADEII